ncbi:MAG: zinc-dependent alcohol dehydrogenase family protein [Candidatus Kariarchaeaceae archaeon]|jgi:NADPH:quinone reductase-like Zn-dependent oxidoreductase
MKVARLNSFGDPKEVVELSDLQLPPFEEHDVLVSLEATPINPSNIYMIQGIYPTRQKPPINLGSEGIGKVVAIGDQVTHLKVGDRVLLPVGQPAWADQFVIPSKLLFPLPDADPLQLAMIGINPPTAYAMLTEFVSLQPGDWVIQNAANSAVGRYVIELCKIWGYRTLNIVRRESLVTELMALGADVVLVDGDDLPRRVRESIGEDKIQLGFDAVAGEASNRLIQCLGHGGILVVYGALSLQNIQVNMGVLMAKDLTVKSFWLSRWFPQTDQKKVKETFSKLIELIAQKKLLARVDKTYQLSEISEAIEHAMQEGRDGKILLTGPAYQS